MERDKGYGSAAVNRRYNRARHYIYIAHLQLLPNVSSIHHMSVQARNLVFRTVIDSGRPGHVDLVGARTNSLIMNEQIDKWS